MWNTTTSKQAVDVARRLCNLALGAEFVVGGQTLRATAQVTVRVERTAVGPGLLPDVATRFAGTATTDPMRAVQLRYPLDGAVIPNNLAPIDVQWEGGAAGDLYRVRLRKPNVDVSGYVTHTGAGFRFNWTPSQALWRALLELSLIHISEPTRPY